MPLRLCSRAPLTTSSRPGVSSRRSFGISICRRPDRYCPVIDRSLASRSSTVPLTTTSPPCSPAPGPMSTIQSATLIVSSSCSTTMSVLPMSRSRIERLDQPGVVPLVQPDRRLVEHVEDADQPGPDLGGQPDALRLTTGQRRRRPVEREVVEADVDQERQPRLDLLEHAVGDRPLALAQLQGAQPLRRVADGEAGDLGDRPAVQLDREDLRLEPGAVADGTGHVAHVALVLVPHVVAVGVLVPALEERHARPRTRRSSCARGRSGSCSGRAPGPASRAARPSAPWPGSRSHGVSIEKPSCSARPVSSRWKYSLLIELGPRRDRALAEALLRVGDDELGVDLLAGADAGALGAGAERAS